MLRAYRQVFLGHSAHAAGRPARTRAKPVPLPVARPAGPPAVGAGRPDRRAWSSSASGRASLAQSGASPRWTSLPSPPLRVKTAPRAAAPSATASAALPRRPLAVQPLQHLTGVFSFADVCLLSPLSLEVAVARLGLLLLFFEMFVEGMDKKTLAWAGHPGLATVFVLSFFAAPASRGRLVPGDRRRQLPRVLQRRRAGDVLQAFRAADDDRRAGDVGGLPAVVRKFTPARPHRAAWASFWRCPC